MIYHIANVHDNRYPRIFIHMRIIETRDSQCMYEDKRENVADEPSQLCYAAMWSHHVHCIVQLRLQDHACRFIIEDMPIFFLCSD